MCDDGTCARSVVLTTYGSTHVFVKSRERKTTITNLDNVVVSSRARY